MQEQSTAKPNHSKSEQSIDMQSIAEQGIAEQSKAKQKRSVSLKQLLGIYFTLVLLNGVILFLPFMLIELFKDYR